MSLRKCSRREPLTWWRYDDGTVRVVCSQGHASKVQHNIMPDGRLVAPHGRDGSMHCGWESCAEQLPLKLDDWA